MPNPSPDQVLSSRGMPARREALPRVAVVLAAGQGKRMRSSRAKVLHEVGGRPMLEWVLAAAREAGCEQTFVVVGHGAEEVRALLAGEDVIWVLQAEQRGTGHALLQVADVLGHAAEMLVLSGDVPLVTARTLEGLTASAGRGWGAMAVAALAAPGNLGRVFTHPDGSLDRIVEAVDASKAELEERRINAGIYALPAPEIFGFLRELGTNNAQGELYLTDALTAAAAAGRGVEIYELPDPSEAWGVNDRQQLGVVHRRMLARKAEELMAAGVTLLDPGRTVIEPSVLVGRDTIVHPGVSLLGQTRIGQGCTLHQGAWLRNADLADGAAVEPYTVLDGARLGQRAKAGPFARLRPGTVLEEGARVGNFVEIKNSRLGPGVRAGHLAYVGDAVVGARANIGAGVVTCNYDGEDKHPTEIGAGAFIGSDTMLVAPVRVGAGATTAAGSVITQDVPDGDLGVARQRQRNVAGWASRRRRGSKNAED